MNSTGIHQSGRSRTWPRAAAMARSITPSRRSSSNSTGMNWPTVSTEMLPCMAITAGTPASASRGPRAASAPSSSGVGSAPAPALWQEASTTSRGRCCPRGCGSPVRGPVHTLSGAIRLLQEEPRLAVHQQP